MDIMLWIIGRPSFNGAMADRPIEEHSRPQQAPLTQEILTPRELQVARLVATGLRNGLIAAELGISVVTVKNHVARIFKKLGVESRMDVMLWIIGREGVVAA